MTKNGRNSVTISPILQLLFLAVIAHLDEDRGDERLETDFAVLANGGLWDVWILLGQTIFNLYSLILELCRGIGPGFTRRWCGRRKDRITEGGDGGAISLIH